MLLATVATGHGQGATGACKGRTDGVRESPGRLWAMAEAHRGSLNCRRSCGIAGGGDRGDLEASNRGWVGSPACASLRAQSRRMFPRRGHSPAVRGRNGTSPFPSGWDGNQSAFPRPKRPSEMSVQATRQLSRQFLPAVSSRGTGSCCREAGETRHLQLKAGQRWSGTVQEAESFWPRQAHRSGHGFLSGQFVATIKPLRALRVTLLNSESREVS